MRKSDAMKSGVKSVGVTLDIIDLIAESSEGITLTQIATSLDISTPSVLRHLSTLEERDFIYKNPRNRRYFLGTRLYILGEIAENNLDILVLADPVMRRLRDKTGLTVNLAGFRANGVVILKSLLGTDATEVRVRLGTELPFHAASQGRVAMAFSKRDLLDVVKKVGLNRYTEFTIADIPSLQADIARVRARGWCMASQETRMGINAMSAPIMDSTGDCVAAITLVALLHNLAREPRQDQVSALLAAAEELSKKLGGKFPETAKQ